MTTQDIVNAFQCEVWKASRIRRIIRGDLDERISDYHYDRLDHCDTIYERLLACDALLDCVFGIDGDPDLELSYLNTGETYDTTIIVRDGVFSLGSWGDLVEELESGRPLPEYKTEEVADGQFDVRWTGGKSGYQPRIGYISGGNRQWLAEQGPLQLGYYKTKKEALAAIASEFERLHR